MFPKIFRSEDEPPEMGYRQLLEFKQTLEQLKKELGPKQQKAVDRQIEEVETLLNKYRFLMSLGVDVNDKRKLRAYLEESG